MGESGVLKDSVTDLSPIMSSFMSANGTRYHLHPELVKKGEVEVISLCVNCLELVNEENDAETETLDPESLDTDANTKRSNIWRTKLRENSMSIAAGFDYGVLSRINELTRPSMLERALLCPHRAYYQTIKVKNPMGLPGSKSLTALEELILALPTSNSNALTLSGYH